MPFYPFLGEGSPTKINYRRKGTLILNSLLEDLVEDLFMRSWLECALAGGFQQEAKEA